MGTLDSIGYMSCVFSATHGAYALSFMSLLFVL